MCVRVSMCVYVCACILQSRTCRELIRLGLVPHQNNQPSMGLRKSQSQAAARLQLILLRRRRRRRRGRTGRLKPGGRKRSLSTMPAFPNIYILIVARPPISGIRCAFSSQRSDIYQCNDPCSDTGQSRLTNLSNILLATAVPFLQHTKPHCTFLAPPYDPIFAFVAASGSRDDVCIHCILSRHCRAHCITK